MKLGTNTETHVFYINEVKNKTKNKPKQMQRFKLPLKYLVKLLKSRIQEPLVPPPPLEGRRRVLGGDLGR